MRNSNLTSKYIHEYFGGRTTQNDIWSAQSSLMTDSDCEEDIPRTTDSDSDEDTLETTDSDSEEDVPETTDSDSKEDVPETTD